MVLALEFPKSDRVSSGIIVFHGFDVFDLLPGFQDLVNSWDEGAGEVKQDRLNDLRGVSGKEKTEAREVYCAEFQLPRQIRFKDALQ